MKLRDIINERVSDIVYHGTTPKNMLSIIESDRFKLKPIFSSGEDVFGGQGFFMSTARSRQGGYLKDRIGPTIVLALDGKKLSSNTKGSAVDFYNSKSKDKRDPKYIEMEDRIFSNKSKIENIKKYILAIEIVLDQVYNSFHIKNVKEVYKWAKNNNIKVTVYDDFKSFSTRNNKGVVSYSDLEKIKSREMNTKPKNEDDVQKYNKELKSIIDIALYLSDRKNNPLSKESEKLAEMIALNKFTRFDIQKTLSKADWDKGLEQIYRYMKKMGIRNYADLLEYFKGFLKYLY